MLRILKCAIGVWSPSLVSLYLHAPPPPPRGWLSRWEHALARRKAQQIMGATQA